MKIICFAILLFNFSCFYVLGSSVSHADDTKTQNVFFVVIDGLRDHEAFSYDFKPGETEHPYIPFIWNVLKPLGVTYKNLYNIGCTYTTPGHLTFVTGNWQVIPNSGYHEYQTHPVEPTIFEYARKELGISKSKTWCVVGKSNVLETNWSLHPNYGMEYGAYLVQAPYRNIMYNADSLTVNKVMEILDAYQPSLLFVNLKEVDNYGHFGIYENYLESIRKADRAIQRIWNRIQTDLNYKGKTTLIITTDHGRHEQEVLNGFQGHGCSCNSCKHLMFLMIGPDTPVNLEVLRCAYMIDIAPTVGALMGFHTKYAHGQVLREAIIGYNLPDRFIMKDPSVDVYKRMAFRTWADNRTGFYEIYFQSSKDMGKTWEHEIQISNSGSCAIQPDINVDAMGAHIVWMDYGSDIWKVLYKRSLDFGLTWDPEKIVFTYQNEPEPIGLWEPNILTEAKNILITVSAYPKKILSSYSLDGGETWKNEFIDQQCFYPRTNNTSRFLNKTGCGIWSDQSNDCDMKGNWEIYYARSVYGLSSWPTLIRLSSNASYSIYPTIDSNGKNAILAAWADNQSGVFKIAYRLSMDRGDSWCDASYISPESCGSWQPVAAWNRSTGNIHVIWTDYRDGDGELYHSNNSGFGWSSAARLTYSIGSVFNPDFAMDADGNSLVIWEEITDTDCQIFSQNFFQQLQN